MGHRPDDFRVRTAMRLLEQDRKSWGTARDDAHKAGAESEALLEGICRGLDIALDTLRGLG